MIHIRKAEPNDIAFISDICLETDEIYSEIMPNAFIKQSQKYKENGLPSSYELYILSNEDSNIGFLGLKYINDNTAYLPAIYLKKNLYRKSYGTKTLNALSDKLKEDNIKEIYLQAHKDAIWAINFYKKYGFTIEANSQILDIKIIDNTIVMKKEL